jgi:hypothetical protein
LLVQGVGGLGGRALNVEGYVEGKDSEAAVGEGRPDELHRQGIGLVDIHGGEVGPAPDPYAGAAGLPGASPFSEPQGAKGLAVGAH